MLPEGLDKAKAVFKEPLLEVWPRTHDCPGEKWHVKTGHLHMSAIIIAITEFFCRLAGWVLLNKKFRVVIDFDPEGRTEIEIKAVTNPNEKHP